MLDALAAFVIALIVGTFVEYWAHRFMHRWLLRKRHARHHREGHGQGWLGEFFDYFTGTIPLLWLGFLWSVEAGIGFVVGGVVYAAFAAYSHQLQHERPELCFWIARPVHYLHHHHHLWHHNFGISIDLWDHVFGTYKQVEWKPPTDRPRTWDGYVRINWWGFAWNSPERDQARPAAAAVTHPRVVSGAGHSPLESPCPGAPSPDMVTADAPPSSPAS